MNEGYLPLYRKYRPQKLEDIVGQSHIKRALTNAIEQNKISHAYLFTGPRGTGKTSTARILAKSLNCVNGPTVTPCEECESCKSITNTIPIDVIELDAASNRSVDDARDILEKVNYAPVQGKYKIYIIDEVHMLTKEAFNALLKTLEEPPKNVIFILATTESHKVLDTIKSRCQRYDFKRITTNDIIEHLKKIADKENIKISDAAISLIAKSAAGGMRDSLALLDQVSTLGNAQEITENDINSLLGRLSFDSLMELGGHIVNSDGASAINSLEKIYNDGNEPIQILTNLMMFFKNILIAKTCNAQNAVELTGLNEEQVKSLETFTNTLEKHQILFLINKISDYIKELKLTTNQQMWLEVSLIDLSNLADNTKLLELESRIARLERGNFEPIQRIPVEISKPITIESTKKEDVKPTEEVVATPEVKNEPKQPAAPVQHVQTKPQIEKVQMNGNVDLMSTWIKILQAIPMNDPAGMNSMKVMASLVQCNENGIVIAAKNENIAQKLNTPEKRNILVEAIHNVLGESDIPVIIRQRLPEDGKAEKVKLPPQKKNNPPTKSLAVAEDDAEAESDFEADVQAIQNPPQKQVNSDDMTLSDQTKLVVNLFDGKIID